MEKQSNIDITFLVIIGCLGIVILVSALIIFIVIHQKRMLAKQNEIQLQKLNHRQLLFEAEIQVAEKEREKIARNIHDDIGSKLNIINQNFWILKDESNNKEIKETVLANSVNLLESVIESSRTIIYELMPPALLKLGYLRATNELCNLLRTSAKRHIEYNHVGENIRFAPKIELQLYRITQEVLNNIMKHSNVSFLKLNIEIEQHLVLKIFHDGKGITNEKVEILSHTGNGLGLRSIQSRVQTLNASIKYGEGSTEPKITIDVPINT